MGEIFIPAYTNASNYAVGVYTEGADLPLWLADALGKVYANFKSSNAGNPAQITWWNNGWNAARSDNLPTPIPSCK
jgi:hypothetical protein